MVYPFNIVSGLSAPTVAPLSVPRGGLVGPYTANAVFFDGPNDSLTIDSPGIGPDSTKVTISVFIRPDPSFGTFEFEVIYSTSISGNGRLSLQRNLNNDKAELLVQNSAGTDSGVWRPIVSDFGWTVETYKHLLLSLDTDDMANKSHWVQNGVEKTGSLTNTITPGMEIGFSNWPVTIGRVGGQPGSYAEVVLYRDLYLDLTSDPSLIELFIKDGKPVDPSVRIAALGEAELDFRGPTDGWHNNKGTGGSFTENGALTDGATPVEVGT